MENYLRQPPTDAVRTASEITLEKGAKGRKMVSDSAGVVLWGQHREV